ncbi:charged multivesicular body protein 4c [Anaeramoeba flamelloides]|uniref:Charged multivesicular body protein 4c n=1 Tax=Anaeramoeba flamelloides TaxID=1746091 RepID=A0ABQ8YZ34_9EUKA|nr:charged multivesicular body protein 4c [Anaeramoeba flamelloides]
MNLFGKKKKKKGKNTTETTKNSIIQLRETLNMLEKRENYLEKKIETELQHAKKNATKNRRSAIMALKRKKNYEQQIAKASNTRFSIEKQISMLEGASMNFEIMKSMKQGAQAMKNIQNEMSIEQVEDVMDEIQESFQIAEEISEAISQPFGDEFDEDELEEELNELEELGLDEQLTQINQEEVKLPNVPKTNLVSNNTQEEEEPEEESEDEELRKLAQSLEF